MSPCFNCISIVTHYIYRRGLTILLVAILFSGCYPTPVEESTVSPLVFAAASLSDALNDVAQEYERKTGQNVDFNFAGSNLLANQITMGAPASAVFVAGYTPISKLINADKVETRSVSKVLYNRLVLVKHVQRSLPSIESPQDLVGNGSIAIADPATAPAGEYAAAALKSAGAWERLQMQIIPTLDVRAALGAVASKNADWAIVYGTDAMTQKNVEIALEIASGSSENVPFYYAATISRETTGNRFIKFLHSEPAASIFQGYGFDIVAP